MSRFFLLQNRNWQNAPFLLRHHPDPDPTLHVLCGHVHPVLVLPGMRNRWPAFWLRNYHAYSTELDKLTAAVNAADENLTE